MTTFQTIHPADTNVRLCIEYRDPAHLVLSAANPRRHPKSQLRKLAAGIRAHGFVVPVLLDRGGEVIAGAARVLAARDVGLGAIPTIGLHHLSDTQAQAFMLADNRLGELSSWNDVRLGEILLDLSLQDLDFSIELTGFDMGEIDLRIEGLDDAKAKAAADKADAPVDVPAGPPVSQPGDLWLLGDHRVLCASALEPASYGRLMGEGRAAMVFTDPPYNVPIAGHVSGLGRIRHREFAMASGEMDQAGFTAFLQTALALLARSAADGALVYVCMDHGHLPELLAAGGAVFEPTKNLCVWVKDNAGMGSLYRSQHELVLVFKKGSGRHRNNVELGRHGRNRTNVWSYPGVNSFGRTGEEGNLLALHPTVKPVRLVADAILDCSARGDLVLDAFLGSGTTLMAAERVGRRCRGLELDPLYVDTVIRRWQAYTGDQARHADTGLTFAEVAAAPSCPEGGGR